MITVLALTAEQNFQRFHLASICVVIREMYIQAKIGVSMHACSSIFIFYVICIRQENFYIENRRSFTILRSLFFYEKQFTEIFAGTTNTKRDQPEKSLC